MPKKLTQEKFIERAKSVHNDEYSYENVMYANYSSKVEIICPLHGTFFQTPHMHLQGQGCPKCAMDNKPQNKPKTMNSFIQEANLVHNNRYDYSKVNYINNKTKVKIICPTHGEFLQTPASHLQGQKCPKCAYLESHGVFTKTLEEFMSEANRVHNNKYDYSNVLYKNRFEKIKIICPIHGEFLQTPHNHLSGCDCPKCGNVKMLQHSYISKKENKSFISSRYENNFLEKISKLYPNTQTNYNNDERYPFMCDFYIPERDLFIELNIHWTHNPKLGWYNEKLKSHQEALRESIDKSLSSKFYKNAIVVWTERDVLKRKTAKKNNLNYVVLWNEQDIKDWFALGCPDGHDGDGMYTWKK